MVLRTENLCKSFRGFQALKDVNVELERGKIYGFVGANGAGKTTLMRIICGMTRADSGTVELFGESSAGGLEHAREKVGALIEEPIYYPELSVRQNLRTMSLLSKTSSFRDVEEIIKLTDIGGYARKSLRSCSTGMKKRYGVAAALLGKPELLVLDEPMSGLDVEGMDEITELIRRIVAERGITVLLSSHQLTRLSKLATDYIFIDYGRVFLTADAETVKNDSIADGGMDEYFRRITDEVRHG